MRTRTALPGFVAVVLACAAVVGCSGGDVPAPGSDRPSRSASASGADWPELPQAEQVPVPEGFRPTHGWTRDLTTGRSRAPAAWAVAPLAEVLVTADPGGAGEVSAQRLDSGETAWTFTPPKRLEDAAIEIHTATDEHGDELAVIVTSGLTPAKGLERSRPMVTVDTVAASAAGRPRPVQHLEYPDAEAGPFAGQLLLTRGGGSQLVAVNPFTGADQDLDPLGTVRLSGCRKSDLPPGAECTAETEVAFTTPQGPVSVYSQDSYCDFRWRDKDYVPCGKGFTVGTAWRSEQVAPDGAAEGTPLAVAGKYLVVAWSAFPEASSEEAAKKDVVAVHHLSDGRLVARTGCDITGAHAGQGSVSALDAQRTTRLSPGGEFVVSGQVGFDLPARRGVCLADTEEQRGVTLTAVSDTGDGYGVAYVESTWADVPYGTFPEEHGAAGAVPSRVTAVDVKTGTVAPLREGAALPVHLGDDAGLLLFKGTLYALPRDG